MFINCAFTNFCVYVRLVDVNLTEIYINLISHVTCRIVLKIVYLSEIVTRWLDVWCNVLLVFKLRYFNSFVLVDMLTLVTEFLYRVSI